MSKTTDKLGEIGTSAFSLYENLESFRDELPIDLQEPINKARELMIKLQGYLELQHDLLVFELRGDEQNLQLTHKKVKRLSEE